MKAKKSAAVILALALIFSLAAVSASALSSDEVSTYSYTFRLRVDNPCNSKDMDKDAVNTLYFQFYYTDKNGFGKSLNQKYDMSWNGSQNKNSAFLKEHFIRANDNAYNTDFTMTLPGKLSCMHIKLNMDGGERLSFTVNSIECNTIRINSNTDYVSSAYSDSEADIYCSMAKSEISVENSPFFTESGKTELTLNELQSAVSEQTGEGRFRDQFNAVIDNSVLADCVETSDGEINQALSHSDEVSMYRYTFYVTVENPIELSYADYDEVETFYISFSYKAENGYGEEKTYILDMAYDEEKGRNLNQSYLSLFEVDDGDGSYKTKFDVWLPGLLTQVNCCLNMSGERLNISFDKVMLGGLMVNTGSDYVSSAYFDSKASILCRVPASCIVLDEDSRLNALSTLKGRKSANLTDQYGGVVSDTLYNKATETPEAFIYKYFSMS